MAHIKINFEVEEKDWEALMALARASHQNITKLLSAVKFPPLDDSSGVWDES